jgi:predicted metal-dependent phosphoesterase TrpH
MPFSLRRILELGAARGLKLMVLTDHNSSLNCPAFAKLCPQYGIIPIFGMEVTTSEEIHVYVCLPVWKYAWLLTNMPTQFYSPF